MTQDQQQQVEKKTTSRQQSIAEQWLSGVRDKLEASMVLQGILQETILGEAIFNDKMPDGLKDTLLVGYMLGMIVESAEAIKAIRYRPEWDKHVTDYGLVKEEVVDVFHYLMNQVLVLWQGDPDAFWASYTDKWLRNQARAEARR